MDRHQNDAASGRDRTPEPTLLIPQAPVPKRMRRRPRAKTAPTNFFLSQISSCDIPIPTVEVAEDLGFLDFSNDVEMLDRAPSPSSSNGYLAPEPVPSRYVTPPPRPRTPEPSWGSKDISPDRATASPFDSESPYSTNTSNTSFDSDMSAGVFGGNVTPPQVPNTQILTSNGFWSKEMNKHLWSVYEKYTVDPTTTPFNTSSPPDGVYRRVVARARATWKGGPSYGPAYENNTSTEDMAWPHTNAATRSKLREMVKRNSGPVGTARNRNSRSPSPTELNAMRRGVHKSRSGNSDRYSVRGIALALATSTSETMQPDGPLAQLSRDPGKDVFGGMACIKTGRSFVADATRQKRGASPPFIADTFSPGSSKKEPELPKSCVARTFGGPGTDVGYFCGLTVQAALAREAKQEADDLAGTPREELGRYTGTIRGNYARFMALRESSEEAEVSRARRAAMRNSPFKYQRETPVLPPGWGSLATGVPSQATSQPTTIASDPIVPPARLDSPFAPSKNFPRERVQKKQTQSTTQRAPLFDNSYFRRFNEEQARLASVEPDVEMEEDSDTNSDSSEE